MAPDLTPLRCCIARQGSSASPNIITFELMRMARQADLLLTKIRIPKARPDTVLRPRLIELLTAGLTRKLTLLSAPPGYSKTTLLADWISTPAGSAFPVAWLSLEESDNDPVRFWRYVITALRTLCDGWGEDALNLLDRLQPPPLEVVLTSLINSMLAEQIADFALVLDDYQTIRLEQIHAGMAYLLKHLPPPMHLVIATQRTPLELPLARLRVGQELVEIKTEDLRFMPQEAATFFEKTLARPLGPAEVEMLEKRTEGWAAGLQLAALTLQNQPDPASFIRSFSGNQRLVLDYLADEVFYQQPAPVQQFLLQTSILARLNEGLALAVSSLPNSREILEMLERNNLFLTSLDDERRWYRYHSLFAEFLAGLLQQNQPEMIPELHRRASAWYETNGFMAEALQHSLAACDYQQAVELLTSLVLPLVHQGEQITVMRWFAALPENILSSNPRLNYLYSVVLMHANLFDEMEAPLKRSEISYRQLEDTAGLTEILVVRSFVALIRGETEYCKALARQVLELGVGLDETALIQSPARLALGSAFLMEGAIEQAEVWLNQGWHSWAELLARNMLAEAQFLKANLKQAEAQSQELLNLATKNTWQEGFARVRLGRIYLEWNRLEEARFWLEQAIAQNQHLTQSAYLPEAYLALARLEWSGGFATQAELTLDKAERAAERLKHRTFAKTVAAWRKYFELLKPAGDPDKVWQWVEQQSLMQILPDQLVYPQERHYLTLVRALVAREQFSAALLRLEWLARFAKEQGRITSLVEILGLKALILAVASQKQLACSVLMESVQLAATGNIIRFYLDEGAAMQQLLWEVRNQEKAMKPASFDMAFCEKLLAGFDNLSAEPAQTSLQPVEPEKTGREKEPYKAAFSSSAGSVSVSRPEIKNNSPLIEPISNRELEVLRLIGEGLSNKAIAERLCLSLATVKTHINHLYAKLEVDNRVQALARARFLNLN